MHALEQKICIYLSARGGGGGGGGQSQQEPKNLLGNKFQ